ncbi:MAG TPA: hydroxymethylbilane synthase [Phycisphaerae bacterium]|nr:hydroxymethylbilane synthase [Phycisphaerae bacterium]
MSVSLVLAAHGSNAQPLVNARIRELAETLESNGRFTRVLAAFHQGDPHFSEVLDQLPVGRTVVVPLMTSAGFYCDKVLPRELRRNESFDADLVEITAPVGAHPLMRTILVQRIRALVQENELNPDNLAVLLVGHGTPRHEASRTTTIKLADELQRDFETSMVTPAFIDDEPSVQDAFASSGTRDCIVLPFFIGSGMHAVEDVPAMFGGRDVQRRLVIDRPVGMDDGILEIVRDLTRPSPEAPAIHAQHVRTIRLGTRSSKMALWQANNVADLLRPSCRVEIVEISTLGDRDRTSPIDALPANGPFTDDLETALVKGRIDVAVHSLKDLPLTESPQTGVAALLPRGDARECIVTRERVKFSELPTGATVGTSCARRALQVLRLRPDLRIVPLRGPVDDRVRQVRDGKMDAAILAWVGLQRLDLLDAVDEVFAIDQFLPAPGQAALAIQIRADDRDVAAMVAPLDDVVTRAETALELSLQRSLEQTGNLSVAAYAKCVGARYELRARILQKDTGQSLDIAVSADLPDAALAKALDQLQHSQPNVQQEAVH